MPKVILKIVIICAIILALLFVAAYLIFKLQGKNIIEKQLAQVFTKPAKVGTISLHLPLTVSLKNLEVQDFLKTNIKVSVNPLGLLAGKIVLNNIVLSGAQLRLVKSEDKVVQIPLKQSGKESALPVILGLFIRDGQATYIDTSLEGYQVDVYNIDVKVRKRGLSPNLAFNFNANADIGQKLNREGNFKASGWIDWTKKDMDATIGISDLNTNYIMPFYKGLLGSEASPATMNSKTTLKAKNNDLNIKCHMELAGLKRPASENQEQETGKQKEISILGDLTDLFSSPEGKIVLDFAFNTKLDNPKFNKADIAPNLVGNAARNILSKPPEDIVSSVEKIGQKIKDWGKDKDGEFKDKNIEEIINIFR
jgi:hypothetical protein